jgi:hypothetical protein
MSSSFNTPGNCLLFVTLTDYGKAEICHVDDGKVKCQLVERMFDPWEGIVYQSGEEFDIAVDSTIKHEFCPYDHRWVMVKIYAGYGEGRGERKVGYVVVTMTYVTVEGRLVPICLSDVPVLVVILERCMHQYSRECKTAMNHGVYS